MRIVAVGAEPSLAAALNMNDDWEVVFADDPEQAALDIAGTNVVLVGGGTEEGLRLAESLRSLGITIPVVVVGDVVAPEGARHFVLTPPFTLEELHTSVERAVSNAAQSTPRPDPMGIDAPAERPDIERTKPTVSGSERAARHLEVAPEPVETMPPPDLEAPSLESVPLSEPASQPASAPRPRRHAEAPSRNLLRRRTKEVPTPEEDPVTARLRAAYESVGNVEQAMDDLPVLGDLAQLTQALLKEVLDLLWPQTAAIYLPGPDGFRVWASHGFSQVEKTMAVQTHQPLFVDLLVRHESVLIEPLDMAQQLAAGVGGARTKAFLATPIEIDKRCVGVIVAGREHFENEELDRVAALANEAALGLGLALGLDRLRTKLS